MFGSGYNPYRAKAYAEAQEKAKKAPWGEKIYFFPKGFDIKKYKEFIDGEYEDERIKESVYNDLLKESGFDKKIEELRKKAAKDLASLEWKLKEKIYHSTDAYGRPYTSKRKIRCLEDKVLEENLKKAELLVGERAQHPELEDFWVILINKINEYLPEEEKISKYI